MPRNVSDMRTAAGKRQLVNFSHVLNGDFERVPTFVAATNTTGRWIDGTAGGSLSNKLYGWSLTGGGLDAVAQFDTDVKHSGTASMKLAALQTSGTLSVASARDAGSPALADLIPLNPNTSYTVTAYIKTNNVPTDGAWLDFREFNGAGAITIAANSTSKLSGTNDWTEVSITFTTNANTRYGMFLLRKTVAGNISDAWFDDITLRFTTPLVRSAAAGRASI